MHCSPPMMSTWEQPSLELSPKFSVQNATDTGTTNAVARGAEHAGEARHHEMYVGPLR